MKTSTLSFSITNRYTNIELIFYIRNTLLITFKIFFVDNFSLSKVLILNIMLYVCKGEILIDRLVLKHKFYDTN